MVPEKNRTFFAGLLFYAALTVVTGYRNAPKVLHSYEYDFDRADLSTLKSVVVIHRHGARSPIFTYPNDPNKNYDWGEKGAGELTGRGERIAYRLGKYLRRRYDTFLDPTYTAGEIYAKSSDVDRTITTANLVVAGIFPALEKCNNFPDEFPWHPIPVHTIPHAIDNTITMPGHCPRFKHLLAKTFASPPLSEFTASSSPELFTYIRNQTGLTSLTQDELAYLADTLETQYKSGLKLPPWTKSLYPDPLGNLLDGWMRSTISTPELARLRVGPFLAEIVQEFEGIIHGKPLAYWTAGDLKYFHGRNAKMYLYSGHDETVSALLSAFGVLPLEIPDYTAALMVELHVAANGSSEDSHFIKVVYKRYTDKPVILIDLPNCPDRCTFANFKEKYSKTIMGEEKWKAECRLSGEEIFKNEAYKPYFSDQDMEMMDL